MLVIKFTHAFRSKDQQAPWPGKRGKNEGRPQPIIMPSVMIMRGRRYRLVDIYITMIYDVSRIYMYIRTVQCIVQPETKSNIDHLWLRVNE